MALWLIRSRSAEDEATALQHGLAVIGFTAVGNLATARNLREFQQFCERALAGRPPTSIARAAAQLWAFRGRIKQDDLVLTPRQQRGGVAVGRVAGAYEFRDGLPGGPRHVRPVEWIRRALPRSLFDEDLLLSLSSAASVGSIRRRNGEARVRALAGIDTATTLSPTTPDVDDLLEEDCGTHLEESARDQLRLRLERCFPGPELAGLVQGLLEAQGYRCRRLAPDSDGAVLLLAGRGALGLEPPRLCAQVHVSEVPLGPNAVKDFQATVKNHGAEHGLLIAWRGFHEAARGESERRYFDLRLWDDEDLMDAVTHAYQDLAPTVQGLLSLRRIWVPASDQD